MSVIEASPFDAGTAYAAVDRHRLDDYSPHILRTHDFGKTWYEVAIGQAGFVKKSAGADQNALSTVTEIRGGIPTPAYVRAVREDPKRKGLLYAATELGVYVSFNDGDSWLPLQLNLPVAPVRDLVVHDDDLVIATHGRSFWILDDLSPLRQIGPEVAKSAAYLFAPRTAMRVRSDVVHDTPLPPEEPAGQNPPSGAILDYYLAQPAKEVTLEILDRQGKLVRRFSSQDQYAGPPTNVPIPSYWFEPPPKLETNPGEHRFVWNLRYPDPPSLRRNYDIAAVFGVGVQGRPSGPLALPGEYQVRLAIDGNSYTRPLTVKLDPRLQVSMADLQKQVEMELQISQAMTQAYAALKAQPQASQAPGRRPNPLASTLVEIGDSALGDGHGRCPAHPAGAAGVAGVAGKAERTASATSVNTHALDGGPTAAPWSAFAPNARNAKLKQLIALWVEPAY